MLIKNLLENAIHHSPRGSAVRVSIDRHGFKVQDEGSGVAAADRPHLFERFWRAEQEDGNGAGLGLTICKEICQTHGWRIDYEAPASGGACFVVSTPRT